MSDQNESNEKIENEMKNKTCCYIWMIFDGWNSSPLKLWKWIDFFLHIRQMFYCSTFVDCWKRSCKSNSFLLLFSLTWIWIMSQSKNQVFHWWWFVLCNMSNHFKQFQKHKSLFPCSSFLYWNIIIILFFYFRFIPSIMLSSIPIRFLMNFSHFIFILILLFISVCHASLSQIE